MKHMEGFNDEQDDNFASKIIFKKFQIQTCNKKQKQPSRKERKSKMLQNCLLANHRVHTTMFYMAEVQRWSTSKVILLSPRLLRSKFRKIDKQET